MKRWNSKIKGCREDARIALVENEIVIDGLKAECGLFVDLVDRTFIRERKHRNWPAMYQILPLYLQFFEDKGNHAIRTQFLQAYVMHTKRGDEGVYLVAYIAMFHRSIQEAALFLPSEVLLFDGCNEGDIRIVLFRAVDLYFRSTGACSQVLTLLHDAFTCIDYYNFISFRITLSRRNLGYQIDELCYSTGGDTDSTRTTNCDTELERELRKLDDHNEFTKCINNCY